jgi:N-acetylglucosaminyldiphosphoundecaprenol N-acetyl-beta-D-mannosaminyltransferase
LNDVLVLGVRVDCVDMAGALARIEKLVEAGGHHLVATVNPEFVMRAQSDPEFARVLDSAALSLPDGWGVVWAARRHGCNIPGPVTGVDLIPQLAELCAHRGWRLFLLGAGPSVAAELGGRLKVELPELEVELYAGSPELAADDETVRRIAEFRPHVLLVAFGAPNQELWIDRVGRRIQVPVSIGVGGSFDYLTGRVPRAPRWMRRARMEWAFRLVRQPWRVRRMAVLPVYAARVLRER